MTAHEKLSAMCQIKGASGIDWVIETGTWKGEVSVLLPALFRHVYSVEKSEELHAAAKKRYPGARVTFLLGDSREWLQRLVERNAWPCVWYLDAHAMPGGGGVGAHDHPLLEELATLNRRRYADIIVVDDVHAFGRDGDRSDWGKVTQASILAALDRVRHSEVVGDMFAVWRS